MSGSYWQNPLFLLAVFHVSTLKFYGPPLSPKCPEQLGTHGVCLIYAFCFHELLIIPEVVVDTQHRNTQRRDFTPPNLIFSFFQFRSSSLEIITRRKKSGSHKSKRAPSLLAYVILLGVNVKYTQLTISDTDKKVNI